MTKDRRYSTTRHLILDGHLKVMNDLFDTVPKTVVARDMGTNLARLTKMIANPLLYTFGDMVKIAELLDVETKYVLALVDAQYLADKKGRKKK